MRKASYVSCVLIVLFAASCQIHAEKDLKKGDIAVLGSRVPLLSVAGPNGWIIDYVDKDTPVYIRDKTKNRVPMDGRNEYWFEAISASASIGWIEESHLQRHASLPAFAKDLVYGNGDVHKRAREKVETLDETTKKGLSLYLVDLLLKWQTKLYAEQAVRAAELINSMGPVSERFVERLMNSHCESLANYEGPDARFPEGEMFAKLGPSSVPVVTKLLQSQKKTDRSCANDVLRFMDPKNPGLAPGLSELIVKLQKEEGRK